MPDPGAFLMAGEAARSACARFRAGLDAWARAAGLDAMPAAEGTDAPEAPDARPAGDLLRCRTIGWRSPQSAGRGGDGLSVLCEVLVMPRDGSDRALALLAGLYAQAPGHVEECAPVGSTDPIWATFGAAPRPALRAGLRLEIRPVAAPAPAARSWAPEFRPLRPLSGEVRWQGRGVPNVSVSAPASDLIVRTDARGGFHLPHLSGDELILRKGAVETRYRLAGESHVVIDLQKEG